MSNKYQICTEFYNKYIKLTDTEKERFSILCNRILSKNFILHSRESDRQYYYFVLKHLTLFQNYFKIIDYDLIHYESNLLIALESSERNRTRLKKMDTIMLLVLRLLYQQKAKETTQLNNIMVSVSEIHEEIEKTGLIKGKINKTDLQEVLRNLRNFSIIDYLSSEIFNDDSRIEIYPSLLRVVNIDDMDKLEKQLKSLGGGGDVDEEFDED